MTRKRPEFKEHDDFMFGLKNTTKVTREEFTKFIRNSLEEMRELSHTIRQYDRTIKDYLEEWNSKIELFDYAESKRELNEEERISKDSERDSKIGELQSDFDSLDNVLHNTIQTDTFKVIKCSVSELDNIRELYFEEHPNHNISYIAIVNSSETLSVWGTERASSTIDNRFQVKIRRHHSNYLQTRNYEMVTGWGVWINR